MNKIITLYHGSSKIIQKPLFDFGKKENDYGQGFYCTEDKEKAKEWACQGNKDGYANSYTIDTTDLNILCLNSKKYNILHWLTILIQNRKIDKKMDDGSFDFLTEYYSIDTSKYDLIKGYRADDSYFLFARDFINNGITIQTLEKAMKLGNLGDQVMVKPKKAFDLLQFQSAQMAQAKTYYSLFKENDDKARATYKQLRRQQQDGLFIMDIIRNPNSLAKYLSEKQ